MPLAPGSFSPRSLTAVALLALALPLLFAAPSTTLAQGLQQIPCDLEPVLCPDLIVDGQKMKQTAFLETRTFGASSCSVAEGHAPVGTQRLLRWTFTTPNIGTADLVVGNPSQHPEWFYYAPCHRHYHFHEYADYRLWTLDGYAEWVALRTAFPTLTPEEVLAQMPDVATKFVAGNKGGFCVIDLVDYSEGLMPANWRSCGNQGISIGWADEYHSSLDGQWIVVTGLPSGDYMLEAEVNAERLYQELNYNNNAVAVPVKL